MNESSLHLNSIESGLHCQNRRKAFLTQHMASRLRGNDGEEREGRRLLHFGTVPRLLHLSAWIPAGSSRYAKTPDKGGPDKGRRYEKDMTLAATYSSNGLPRE